MGRHLMPISSSCEQVVQDLDVSQNQLTGDISVVAAMPFLARALLNDNQLTGSLPTQMASSFLQVNPLRL